ncbi:MAG: trypsin-like peptidase domain-containing protein [bacterium]|nr:trypsin-like peptidase domain-containing protein [bacterium]
MNQFFRTPTKVVFLAIFIGLIFVVASSSTVIAEDREPLMDLENGGAQFFVDVVPSIVEVYNGGSGSGYVFDREGHAITNNHVTEGSLGVLEVGFFTTDETLRTAKDARFRADVLFEDAALDLAVIKIDAPTEVFHPIRLGDSAAVNPGDTVATFGSPGGDASVGGGYMGIEGWVDRSATNFMDSWLELFNLNLGVIAEVLDFEQAFINYMRMGEDEGRAGTRDYGSAVEYLFHTDSAINRGNSGGPCINVYGEALGTNTWGYGGENMGLSVPVNLLKRSITDILEYGHVRRPWCGIALHEKHDWNHQFYMAGTTAANFEDTDFLDPTPDTLKIYTVNPYSPAYEAGLREGDIISTVDGQVFENIFDIYSYILAKEVDDVVTIEYERDGHGMPLASITLAEKATRYYDSSTELHINSDEARNRYGWGNVNIPRYVSDLTY